MEKTVLPNGTVHGFLRQMEHFLTDMSNRVEHQNEPKRPQSGGRLGSFWFSTWHSADTGTNFNLKSVNHRAIYA